MSDKLEIDLKGISSLDVFQETSGFPTGGMANRSGQETEFIRESKTFRSEEDKAYLLKPIPEINEEFSLMVNFDIHKFERKEGNFVENKTSPMSIILESADILLEQEGSDEIKHDEDFMDASSIRFDKAIVDTEAKSVTVETSLIFDSYYAPAVKLPPIN